VDLFAPWSEEVPEGNLCFRPATFSTSEIGYYCGFGVGVAGFGVVAGGFVAEDVVLVFTG